jgi:hypothetical protein
MGQSGCEILGPDPNQADYSAELLQFYCSRKVFNRKHT